MSRIWAIAGLSALLACMWTPRASADACTQSADNPQPTCLPDCGYGPLTGHGCTETSVWTCQDGVQTVSTEVTCGNVTGYDSDTALTTQCCAGGACVIADGDADPSRPLCNGQMPECDFEICGNGRDDDCDTQVDEPAACGTQTAGEVCCDGIDNDNDGAKDEHCPATMCLKNCRGIAKPVDLLTRAATVGPHEFARISQDLGGSADLRFAVIYDPSTFPGDVHGYTSRVLRPMGYAVSHNYDDRLILRGGNAAPTEITWVNYEKSISFFQVAVDNWNDWKSEPGANHRLRRDGTSWRIHTAGGDVLEFGGHSTWSGGDYFALHQTPPVGSVSTFRLKKIFPGASAARHILLLYEDDPQGSAVTQVPTSACTDLVENGNGCIASRGLLVKVVVVLDGSTQGPSFEFKYRTDADAPSGAYQFLLKSIVSGGDRVDGVTQSTLAAFEYATVNVPDGGVFKVLSRASERGVCTSTNGSCAFANYGWQVPVGTFSPRISSVSRPGVRPSGLLTTLEDEAFTYNGAAKVLTHKSLGFDIARNISTFGANVIRWRVNEACDSTIEGCGDAYSFDPAGNLESCSSGTCGGGRQWAITTAGYTLGMREQVGDDGIYTFRQFDAEDRGLIEFECELVPSGTGTPSCTEAVSGAAHVISATGGTIRRAEHRYYDQNGRLRAIAQISPQTSLAEASWAFPTSGSGVANWFTPGGSMSSCPSLTTSVSLNGGTQLYDVTVFDADSDGDGVVNEAVFSGTTMPDALIVRTNRSAAVQLSGGTSTSSTCSIFTRNARGDVTRIRTFEGGQPRSDTVLDYITSPSTVRSVGRLASVTAYRAVSPSSANPLVHWQACAANPYDDAGRTVCSVDANGVTTQELTYTGDGAYALRRVTTRTAGALSLTSFTKELAWGPVYESGVGDGAAGGAAEGNSRRFTFADTGGASRELAPGEVTALDSSGAQLWRIRYTQNAFGQLTRTETFDGSNALVLQKDRVPDKQDRTVQLQRGGASGPTESYFYDAISGDLDYATEGDGDVVKYARGASGNNYGRLWEVRRGSSEASAAAQQRFAYTRDGLIADLYNVPLTTAVPVASYEYDALRRPLRETRESIGQTVRYTWHDRARPRSREVLGTNGLQYDYVEHGYDGLGRSTGTWSFTPILKTLHTWLWDGKGSFAGITVPGRGYSLSNTGNLGQPGYVEDEDGATFFEYDALGRVKSVVRHDGPLAQFNSANLTAIDFTYGPTGEVTSIKYPSGRVVTYGYGNDKERPSSITTTTIGTIVSNITYFPTGAPSGWRWGGLSTKQRTISRDLLGRTTGITDAASSPLTVVSYTYDGDGDLTQEQEQSSSNTWLRSGTTGNQSQTLSYLAYKDMLSGWSDDGQAESIAYGSSGRRSSANQGGTNRTYYWSTSNRERLLEVAGAAIYGYDPAGRVVSIDSAANGTVDSTIGYGFFGQIETVTRTAGTYTNKYDSQMRRTKLTSPDGTWRKYRYAFGRDYLQELHSSATGTFRYENVYLAGEPVAQIAKSPTSTDTAYYLVTDRMARVRKIVSTGGSLIQRHIADVWGTSNAATGRVVNHSFPDPTPRWMRLYAGQDYDATGLITNGWRSYLPEIGQYTSPDPLHATSASTFYGPQAYSYAAARPLLYTDPEGLLSTCDWHPEVPGCMSPPTPAPTPIPTPTPTPGPAPGTFGFCIRHPLVCLGLAELPVPGDSSDGNDDECEQRDSCQEQYDKLDIPHCRSLRDAGARARCFASAMERLVQCRRGGYVPPLEE